MRRKIPWQKNLPGNNSARKTRHHTITRGFIRDRGLKLRRGSVVPIPDNLHQAYHMIFGHKCAWTVVKTLKEWARQIKRRESPVFFERFTKKQVRAFVILFGFEPYELGNGSLCTAINLIQDSGMFYPKAVSMVNYQSEINQK